MVMDLQGWMLLNYKKPIAVSSTLGTYAANNANDEDLKTYWSAATSNKGEWIQSDLGNVSTVNAIQINYADQDVDSDRLGKVNDQYHQYKLYYSPDGRNGMCSLTKAITKQMCHTSMLSWKNLYRPDLSSLKTFTCRRGGLLSVVFAYLGNGNGSKARCCKRLLLC
jgi:hypothetical protein